MPATTLHPKVKAGAQVTLAATLLVALARIVGLHIGIDTATEVAVLVAGALPVIAGYAKAAR